MNKKKKVKKYKEINIICPICKKQKVVTRYWAKYCSNTCRQIGWAIKKAKELNLEI